MNIPKSRRIEMPRLLSTFHVTGALFLSRPQKQAGAVALDLQFHFAIFYFLHRRLVAAHTSSWSDLPIFAMIYRARHIYDPDATSAL